MSDGIKIQNGCLVHQQGVTHNGQNYDVVMTVRDAQGAVVLLDGQNDDYLQILAGHVHNVALQHIALCPPSADLSRWGWIYQPTSQAVHSIEAPVGENAAAVIEAAKGKYDGQEFVKEVRISSKSYSQAWAPIHELVNSTACMIAQRQVPATYVERRNEYNKILAKWPAHIPAKERGTPEAKRQLKAWFQESEAFWQGHEKDKETYRRLLVKRSTQFPQYAYRQNMPLSSLEELLFERSFRKLHPNQMVDAEQLRNLYQEIMSS